MTKESKLLISASVIVKNEEEVIQRCIDSLSVFADEIVIVDTGSTDRTKEIASAHPKVRLFDSDHFNKDTHFSDFQFNIAKNEAISKCQGRWIFWADADDYIDPSGGAAIKALAEVSKDDVVYVIPIEFHDMSWNHCRMFRKSSGVCFDGYHSCHEFLDKKGRDCQIFSGAKIEHRPGKRDVSPQVRNLSILEKDYFERKYDDQRTLFYLANAYREASEFDKAVEFYSKYLEVSKWPEERYFATLYKARILSIQQKHAEAIKAVYSGMAEDDRFAESYCLIGDILSHLKQYKRALHWYEMASEMSPPEDSVLFVEKSFYDAHPKKCIEKMRNKLGVDDKKTETPVVVESLKDDSSTEASVKTPRCSTECFTLPVNTSDALIAIQALLASKTSNARVFSESDLIRGIAEIHPSLELSDKKGMKMDLPSDLLGLSKTEWYMRNLGVINGEKSFLKLPREAELVVLADEFSAYRDYANDPNVVTISSDCGHKEAIAVIKRAKAFIGYGGWLSQLASIFGVPATVVWRTEDDKRSESNRNQNNRTHCQDIDMPSLIKERTR